VAVSELFATTGLNQEVKYFAELLPKPDDNAVTDIKTTLLYCYSLYFYKYYINISFTIY